MAITIYLAIHATVIAYSNSSKSRNSVQAKDQSMNYYR